MSRTVRNLFRYWMLCICERVLGDEIGLEEQVLLAKAYEKLLESDREIEKRG